MIDINEEQFSPLASADVGDETPYSFEDLAYIRGKTKDGLNILIPSGRVLATIQDWKDQYLLSIEVGQGIVNRVRALHRPVSVDVLPWKCHQGDCHHEDECPIEDMSVCRECHSIASSVDDEAAAVNEVVWPCATAKALVD